MQRMAGLAVYLGCQRPAQGLPDDQRLRPLQRGQFAEDVSVSAASALQLQHVAGYLAATKDKEGPMSTTYDKVLTEAVGPTEGTARLIKQAVLVVAGIILSPVLLLYRRAYDQTTTVAEAENSAGT